MEVKASHLRFPEGPVSVADGSVLVVEIAAGNLTRIRADGARTVVAHCGGGPNGAAIGPDGYVYVCNNGGLAWARSGDLLTAAGRAGDNTGGFIQRVDPRSGEVATLYSSCDGRTLSSPNDLVFDESGGFWFTDTSDGSVCYADVDGKRIDRVLERLDTPNGIGLSPDGSILYVAESRPGCIRAWPVVGPGRLGPGGAPFHELGDSARADSLAVDGEGAVCIGTVGTGGITRVDLSGVAVGFWPVPQPDPVVSNICFDVLDRRIAYVTSSGRGVLYAMSWVCEGVPLAYEAVELP
jgi:gluconolactonase